MFQPNHIRTFILSFLVITLARPLAGQNTSGFMFFGGTITSINSSDDGKRVQLGVDVMKAPMTVVIDENTTVTGSLGGRSTVSTLAPNLFIEVEGMMGPDGVIRAWSVQTKVQSGAIRMYGRIENILQQSGTTSLLVDGVEIRVDSATAVVINRNGIGVSGAISDLKLDDSIDITAAYVNDTGVGQTTSGLFRASSIVVQRSFRIQGQIRSRTPAEGNPSIITVQGVVVTITPDTLVAGDGMNERDEAFLSRKSSLEGAVVNAIEDDAGNPCTTTPNACPDKPPSDPRLAGELQIGSFVRVEGMLENTGFSTRYTARLIQVEKADQLRFHAIVESRTDTSMTVRLNDSIRTQVVLDSSTVVDGRVSPGVLVDITAHLQPNLSVLARRVRVIQ